MIRKCSGERLSVKGAAERGGAYTFLDFDILDTFFISQTTRSKQLLYGVMDNDERGNIHYVEHCSSL